MTTNRPRRWITAAVIGCGLCCLPFLLPAAGGVLGLSLLGFSTGALLCGMAMLLIAIAVFWFYRVKRKQTCTVRSVNK